MGVHFAHKGADGKQDDACDTVASYDVEKRKSTSKKTVLLFSTFPASGTRPRLLWETTMEDLVGCFNPQVPKATLF